MLFQLGRKSLFDTLKSNEKSPNHNREDALATA